MVITVGAVKDWRDLSKEDFGTRSSAVGVQKGGWLETQQIFESSHRGKAKYLS